MPAQDPSALDAVVVRVQAGDREAYRHIVECCEGYLRVVAAAIVQDPQAVEEVVQDAFVTAYAKLGDYRPGGNVLAWLAAIARNVARNERRRWYREQRRRGPVDPRIVVAARIEQDLMIVAAAAPDDLVHTLRRCMDRLGDTGRAVVEAFYWSGQRAEAIAQTHGKTVGWVRVVLHRARAALGACIQQRGSDG